jgi:hypothetical protein
MNLWQVNTQANLSTDSTHAINSTVWRATYSTLETGKINSQYNLPSIDSVNKRVERYRQANPTYNPIMLLEAGYSCLDSNAVRDNLFTVQNGQLRDVPNRSRSPYVPYHIRMGSAEVQDDADGEVTFIMPSALLFSSVTTPSWETVLLTDIVITSEGNEKKFDLSANESAFDKPFTFNYTTAGVKTVSVVFSAGDGTFPVSFIFHIRITGIKNNAVNPLFRTTGGRNDGDSTGNAQTARYENQPLQEVFLQGVMGVHHGARLQIRRSQTNNLPQADGQVRLRKPLIILEGYDPSVHNRRLFSVPFTSFMWLEFAENYNLVDFLGVDENRQRLRTGIDAPDFSLNTQWDAASYDLIFVDYVHGTDDIVRNARMFEDVLRWVNARKENNAAGVREQNVVLGMSMGGLVGRYGLAEMEKNRRSGVANNDHEVRMLITHDSPHRGANVPVAMQSLVETLRPLTWAVRVSPFLNFLGGNAIDFINNEANSQMAIYRTVPIGSLLAGNIQYQKNTWIDETYQPMVTFPAASPAPYQFIALSNGSECGTRLAPPFNHLITNRYSGFIQPIPWLIKSKITTEMMMRGLPDRQARKIYNLGVYFTLSLFGGWIEINQDLIAARGHSRTDMLPIDGMAGGTESAGMVFRVAGSTDYQTPAWLWFGGFERFNESARNYCFVPKYSALDIRPDVPVEEIVANQFHATQTPSRSTANRIFTAPSNSSPLNTAGNEFNQLHISFNNRNAAFIFSQMEPALAAAFPADEQENNLPILDCSAALCNPASLQIQSSQPSLCFGATPSNVFSISNLPTPATVAWSADNNLVIIATPNATNTVITPTLATSRGWVTITAVVTSVACNNFTRTVTRQVWVGAMQTMTGFQSRVLTPRACEKTFRYTARNAAGGERLIYTYNAGLEDESSNEGYFDVTVPYGRCLDFTLTVNAVGACGDTQQITRSLRTCSPLTPPGQAPCMARVIQPTQPVVSIKAYPNPTADKLNLAFENLSSPVAQISVQNSLGVKVLETTKIDISKENITSLDLGHLPDGLYILTVIFENGERSNVKVVVQKGNIAN